MAEIRGLADIDLSIFALKPLEGTPLGEALRKFREEAQRLDQLNRHIDTQLMQPLLHASRLAQAALVLPPLETRSIPSVKKREWPKREGRWYVFAPGGGGSQAAFREAKRENGWS